MKNKRVLKILLIIIFILIIAFAIYLLRNFIILSKIQENQSMLLQSNNYSFVREVYKCDGSNEIMECFYKDGKNKLILAHTDTGISSIQWYDENTKEIISIEPDTNEALVTTSETVPWDFMPTFEIDNMFKAIITSRISSGNINGIECYIVQNEGVIRYISKTDGTILKTIDKRMSIKVNGEVYDYVVEYKDWKINELTDEDLIKPDLSQYEVKNA